MILLLTSVFVLPLEGITKQHFKDARCKYQLNGMVQIHHIIPRQFRNHPLLNELDIDGGYNLIFMPTKKGKTNMHTRRLPHDGGHSVYNRFVGRQLEATFHSTSKEHYQEEVIDRIINLRKNLTKNSTIPWR